jgi:hypothetical protein
MYEPPKAEWSSNHYTAGNSGAYYKFYIIVIWTDSKKVEWSSNHYTTPQEILGHITGST